MDNTIWSYWMYLEQIIRVRDYMANSYLFALYEGPVMRAFDGGWPWLHLILAGLYYYCVVRIHSNDDAYAKYHDEGKDSLAPMMWFPIILVPYLLAATIGGAHIATYKEIARANPTLTPRVLPPAPAPLPSNQHHRLREPNSPLIVPTARAQVAFDMSIASRQLRTALDFFILFTPLALLFIAGVAVLIPKLIFSFTYSRALARPHLPTEIVNLAISGQRIDGTTLANALSQSTAPVVRDSLADKIERERLTALANRLQQDTARLDDKITKEAEIARLVGDHARKRKELADMEHHLRNMGVKRDG